MSKKAGMKNAAVKNDNLKRNVCIQMINKLNHKLNPKIKAELDPPPPAFRFPKPLVSEDPSEVKPIKYSKIAGTIPKFETRFLNNVCNVEQFSFYC